MHTCDYTYLDFRIDSLNTTCKFLYDYLEKVLMKNVQPYDLFGKCYYASQPSNKFKLYDTYKSLDEMNDVEEKVFRSRVRTVYDYANFKYRNRPDFLKLKDEQPACGTYDGVLLDFFNNATVMQ